MKLSIQPQNSIPADANFNPICVCVISALEVGCWPLVPKFANSNSAEPIGFLRAKIPQHSFLRKGSKAVPCRRFAACKRSLTP